MDANREGYETQETQPLDQKEPLSVKGIAAAQGEAERKSDWVDHGIIDVQVSDLPDPENVSSPEDFDHHISWEDAQKATKQLPEIQKEVNGGKTGDDFYDEDQAAGLDHSEGKKRIYDLYYGSDPVRLDKVGDQYDIVSGRHRIFAAKELGLDTIPARVREKIE
jgi:hypothetical protein